MLVRKWMSKNPITIDINDTLTEAIDVLKRNRIRRLPVLKDGKLVGIVSDRDLKEASPSKVTSLDIWEVHYLLSKIKIKDIYRRNPITIRDDSTVEKAAVIMYDEKVGGLPVVDGKGDLVGMLTEHDVFNALIRITGARVPSYRVSMCLPDEGGAIKEVCDILDNYKHKCISILNTYYEVRENRRSVIIRFQTDKENVPKIIAQLEEKFENVQMIEEL